MSNVNRQWVRVGELPETMRVTIVVARSRYPDLHAWLSAQPFGKGAEAIREALQQHIASQGASVAVAPRRAPSPAPAPAQRAPRHHAAPATTPTTNYQQPAAHTGAESGTLPHEGTAGDDDLGALADMDRQFSA